MTDIVRVMDHTGVRRIIILDPPEGLRYVTAEDQSIAQPRADIPDPGIWSRWVDEGMWAVLAVGALALIADGLTLWFIAWLIS